MRVLEQRLTDLLRERADLVDRDEISAWYRDFYLGHMGTNTSSADAPDLLGHYFELLYHIVNYVDKAGIPDGTKKFTLRILRVHLLGPRARSGVLQLPQRIRV